MAKKAWWQNVRLIDCHIVSIIKTQKALNAGVQLAFSPFSFYLISNTFEVDLSGNMLPDIFRGVPPR